eukprot:9439627-Karenia_brevis.AAC.1
MVRRVEPGELKLKDLGSHSRKTTPGCGSGREMLVSEPSPAAQADTSSKDDERHGSSHDSGIARPS